MTFALVSLMLFCSICPTQGWSCEQLNSCEIALKIVQIRNSNCSILARPTDSLSLNCSHPASRYSYCWQAQAFASNLHVRWMSRRTRQQGTKLLTSQRLISCTKE